MQASQVFIAAEPIFAYQLLARLPDRYAPCGRQYIAPSSSAQAEAVLPERTVYFRRIGEKVFDAGDEVEVRWIKI